MVSFINIFINRVKPCVIQMLKEDCLAHQQQSVPER